MKALWSEKSLKNRSLTLSKSAPSASAGTAPSVKSTSGCGATPPRRSRRNSSISCNSPRRSAAAGVATRWKRTYAKPYSVRYASDSFTYRSRNDTTNGALRAFTRASISSKRCILYFSINFSSDSVKACWINKKIS